MKRKAEEREAQRRLSERLKKERLEDLRREQERLRKEKEDAEKREQQRQVILLFYVSRHFWAVFDIFQRTSGVPVGSFTLGKCVF